MEIITAYKKRNNNYRWNKREKKLTYFWFYKKKTRKLQILMHFICVLLRFGTSSTMDLQTKRYNKHSGMYHIDIILSRTRKREIPCKMIWNHFIKMKKKMKKKRKQCWMDPKFNVCLWYIFLWFSTYQTVNRIFQPNDH